MDLYYFRHFSELNEAAKTKTPKEMSVPVKALLMVSCTLAAPFMAAAGLILVIGFGAVGIAAHLISGEKSFDEIDDAEFDETIDEIESIQKQLTQLQKRSKYYNLIYRYHKIDSFIDVDASKHTNINIHDQFKRGKVVAPLLSVLYYCPDGISDYKNFLKTFPNQDIACYEGENNDYLSDRKHEIFTEMQMHLKTIGYSTDKKEDFHKKYPHCDLLVNWDSKGFYVWIRRRGKTRIKRKDIAE